MILLFVIFLTAGCYIPNRSAPPEQLTKVHRILICPVESTPINPGTAVTNTLQGLDAGSLGGSPGSGALALIIVSGALLFGTPHAQEEIDEFSKTIEDWQKDNPWSPTQVIADQIAEILNSNNRYNTQISLEPQALPGLKNRKITWHMENWFKPVRTWYRSEDPLAGQDSCMNGEIDAVIETGCYPIEFCQGYMLLHIPVKLIDCKTGKVIARSHSNEIIEVPGKFELFKNKGELFESIFSEASMKILQKNLQIMGLIPDKSTLDHNYESEMQ